MLFVLHPSKKRQGFFFLSFFPGKLLKSNFVTFLVLVGLDFSYLPK